MAKDEKLIGNWIFNNFYYSVVVVVVIFVVLNMR